MNHWLIASGTQAVLSKCMAAQAIAELARHHHGVLLAQEIQPGTEGYTDMLAELAAANAAFAVIKQAVANGKEIASAGNAIAQFVGAKEKLQQRP